jgi:beta-barrel assembly-enhancing protease
MGNNNGLGGRLLGAGLILAIGFIMYLMQVQKNPVTGEKQHVSMSPSQEIRLGLQSAPAMTQKMGGEVSSADPHAIEVQKIGNFLVSHTVAKISPWKFQFHLLADTKTVNAFALPGGQIFITMGLLNKLQTEAQLAGVLSHEMGHVIERHSAEQMAKSQLGQALIMAVGVGARDPNHPGYAMNAAMVASLINHMVELRYSRKDESEADIWGLKLMSQAGFDPKAMIQVMEILKAADTQGHRIEMLQTHPNPDLRIQNINSYLQEHPSQGNLQEGRNLKDVFGNS